MGGCNLERLIRAIRAIRVIRDRKSVIVNP